MDAHAWLMLGIGILLGWLVLPMVLNIVTGRK